MAHWKERGYSLLLFVQLRSPEVELFPAILGAASIALALFDLFVTVLTTQGGGPVSSRLGAVSWRAFLRVHRRNNARWALAYAGSLIAILTVLGWILMFWTGWFLIFSSQTENLVRATTGEPADLWARLYFSGYTLFTLGLGDYRPEGEVWQGLTTLVAGNGFIVITLAASYLIPVVSAATSKRSLALYLDSLGTSPSQILISMWDGRGFSSLSQHLMTLSPMIIQAGQQHLAYPVLHYFQSTESKAALPVQIARFGEVLDLLEHGVQPKVRLPGGITAPARHAILAFTRVLERAHLPIPDEAPPPADLEPLSSVGIPVVTDPEYREAVAQWQEEQRRRLAAVRYSGWSWKDVTRPRQEEPF